MKMFNEAAQSYEAALKIKSDADTLHNLEWVKKQKKQQRKSNQSKRRNSKHNQKNKVKKGKKPHSNQEQKAQQKARQKKKLDRLAQKKWENSLRKPVQTLMIPLDEKNTNEENNNNPW
jgi:Ca-activated chloride channel family protein